MTLVSTTEYQGSNSKVSCCKLPSKHREEEVVVADHRVVVGVLHWEEAGEAPMQPLKTAGSEQSSYQPLVQEVLQDQRPQVVHPDPEARP